MKFTIEYEMKDRWVNNFLSMLKYMEKCGKDGHSELIGFYSDGDGDFRPEFKFNIDFEQTKGIKQNELINRHKNDCYKIATARCLVPGTMFDAG